MTDAPDILPEGEEGEPRQSLLRQVFETLLTIAVAWALAQGVRAYVVEGYKTPTPSMVPTIETQDITLFSKLSYRFGTPQPGDIVTLDDPQGVLVRIMKRVIAVGGQTVDIQDGRVLIDGKPLDEPYTRGQPTLRGTVQLPVTIPDGYAWVMGDNRANSLDSRYYGPVPISSIRAKALFRYWPPQRWGVPDS